MLPKKKLKYLLVFKKWAFFGQKQPSYIRKLQKNTAVATVRSIDAFFATDLYIVAAWHSSIFQKPPHFLSCSKFFVKKKGIQILSPFRYRRFGVRQKILGPVQVSNFVTAYRRFFTYNLGSWSGRLMAKPCE